MAGRVYSTLMKLVDRTKNKKEFIYCKDIIYI